MLSLCQHGYEALLERELTAAGLAVTEKGPGWALAGRASRPDEQLSAAGSSGGFAPPDLAFPSLTLLAPREFKGESVNALAAQLAEYFLESLRGEKIEAAWPCVFQTVPEVVGLGRRDALQRSAHQIGKVGLQVVTHQGAQAWKNRSSR